MNTIKEAITKLANEVAGNKEPETKVELVKATLTDGTEVHYEGELVEGSTLYLDEAMTQTAPAGTHQTSEGVEVVVGENGLVSSVTKLDLEKKEDMENLSKVVLSLANRVKSLEESKKNDVETIEALRKEVDSHKVLLSKVKESAPESTVKLQTQETSNNNYLSKRVTY
jgi:hypothetical protein